MTGIKVLMKDASKKDLQLEIMEIEEAIDFSMSQALMGALFVGFSASLHLV